MTVVYITYTADNLFNGPYLQHTEAL